MAILSSTTGLICFRWASAVTDVPLEPMRREICPIGISSSDGSVTKLCRSSASLLRCISPDVRRAGRGDKMAGRGSSVPIRTSD